MVSKRQFMIAPITGRIFDGVPTKAGLMPDNREDRTEECIRAVITHMDAICKDGQHTIIMDGVGALTYIKFPLVTEREGSE